MQVIWKPSPNHSGNEGPKHVIVIHWWGDPAQKPSLTGTVNWLCNPASQVSAHYVVSGSTVYQLVQETDVAWHARAANSFTIGIEVDPNTPGATYDTVSQLCREIAQRHLMNLPLAIQTHRNYVATTCPGTLDIERIRRGAVQEDDMDAAKVVDDLYRRMTGKNPAEYHARQDKISFISGGGDVGQLADDFIRTAQFYLPANRFVDETYEAGGYDPGAAVRIDKTGAITGGLNPAQLIREVVVPSNAADAKLKEIDTIIHKK